MVLEILFCILLNDLPEANKKFRGYQEIASPDEDISLLKDSLQGNRDLADYSDSSSQESPKSADNIMTDPLDSRFRFPIVEFDSEGSNENIGHEYRRQMLEYMIQKRSKQTFYVPLVMKSFL